jgi:tripartite-type tricarboxylate transporter receptor subunit TctC
MDGLQQADPFEVAAPGDHKKTRDMSNIKSASSTLVANSSSVAARRHVLRSGAKMVALSVGLGLGVAALSAHGQSPSGAAPAGGTGGYPNKPIRLVVTFPPGGSSDIAARLVAPKLGEKLGTQVIVDNRPGAGGGIGLEAVAKSPADGYTLVLASAGGLTANPSLYKKLSYDPVKDFAPISLFGTSPFVLIASDTLKAATTKDVLALAKAKPGQLSYASGGNGTAMHLSGELLKSMSNSFIVHIPYRGTSPAVLAAMSGETQLAIADIASVQQQAKSGRIKLIAVMSKERSPLAPDIPTLAESGVPGYESSGWFAVLAPAGTPPAIVQRLNTELTAVLRQPDIKASFLASGLEPLPSTSEELTKLMKSETEKWAAVIKTSGAKID